MTKTDFINRFAEETTWTKKDSEFAINTAIKVISDFLAEGEKLALINLHFGQVKVTVRMAQVIQMLYLELDIMVY